MNWKPAVITFAIAALSVIIAIVTAPSSDQQARRGAVTDAALISADDLPAEGPTRITLDRKDRQPLVFERGDDGWMQTEPFEFPMSSYHIRRLVTTATTLRELDRLPVSHDGAGLTLETVTLDEPLAVMTLEWAGGRKTIRFGRQGVAGRAYLQLDDEPVIRIVEQDLHTLAVEQSPREWRDRMLFREVGVESRRISRDVGDDKLTLERDRRTWTMREPTRTRLDREALDEFFNALGSARAKAFISDQPRDLSRFGLAPPVARLDVVTEQAQFDGDGESEPDLEEITQTLLIGSPAGGGTQDRFAMIEGRPVVMRVDAATLGVLFVNAVNLIDPTASGEIAADIKSMRITGPDGEFTLTRDMEDWIAPDWDDHTVPADAANQLLETLTERAAERLGIQQYPHEMEVATVTLYGFGGTPRDTVRIVRDPDSGRYFVENGDNVLRQMPAGVPLRLTPREFGLAADR